MLEHAGACNANRPFIFHSFSVHNTSGIDLSECKISQLGIEYKGFINITISGFRCQLWTAARLLYKVSL